MATPALTRSTDFVRQKAGNAVYQTGALFITSIEGFRKTWNIRQWWAEYVEQCYFIAKVTALPVILIALPLGGVTPARRWCRRW